MEYIGNSHIIFIGCGHMGRPLLEGLVKDGLPPEHITVIVSSHSAHAQALAMNYPYITVITADQLNSQANFIADHDIIIPAVKPQQAQEALQPIGDLFKRLNLHTAPIVLSIMAGKTMEQIADFFPKNSPVIRAMPNLNARAWRSITPYCSNVRSDRVDNIAEDILRTIGTTRKMQEADMHAVTAISGCGPAYALRVMQLMIERAKADGVEDREAAKLACKILQGVVSEEEKKPLLEKVETTEQRLIKAAKIFHSLWALKAQKYLGIAGTDLVNETINGTIALFWYEYDKHHIYESVKDSAWSAEHIASSIISRVRSEQGVTDAALRLVEKGRIKSHNEEVHALFSLEETVQQIQNMVTAAYERAEQLAAEPIPQKPKNGR